jgi:thiosulfate reductase cytochrome b subunit
MGAHADLPAISIATVIHPWPLRAMHWINALAVIVMMASGGQIYNASPIFVFRFPTWSTLGGWLGGALLWHFAAMWILAANGICYVVYGFATGRFQRKLLPLSPRQLLTDTCNALRGRLAHHDLSTYNAVQKFSYACVIVLLALVTISGVAVWKPVQFDALSQLFGGFQGSRIVHFIAMSGIALFLVVHVAMSALVPRSLLAMLRGR